MRTIKVTCAIIEVENKVLAVQRSEDMNLPFKWEFPGGKIEAGETPQKSIVREIKEELNLEIELVQALKPVVHDYPNQRVQLIPFIAKMVGGTLKLLEHKQYQLLERNQLRDLDWAEADIPVVKQYEKL
ncbi:MAG: (deoxy)nucleoside triphosphate pyrophosphohydrolase [Saprospirales bacterium]|nr:MAG: (deoxy)nucleoside triphosphate pyrophosphohydrolase [Saprospirales bacterium]